MTTEKEESVCMASALIDALTELVDEYGDLPLIVAALDYSMMMPVLAVKCVSEGPEGEGGDQAIVISFDSNNIFFNTQGRVQ